MTNQNDGGPTFLIEALKETYRHIEELYRQAGEGRGLLAARQRAKEITDAMIAEREKGVK